MRGINHHVGSDAMALITGNVDVVTPFRQVTGWLGQRTRHALCGVLHGGHELYRARTDTKIYRQCLLCGYETTGWTIERRDRRLHLVSSQPSSVVGRR